MIDNFMDFIFVVCCLGIMTVLGLVVLVMVNSPIIEKEPVQVEQSLNYTDYVNFVNKEEACQK